MSGRRVLRHGFPGGRPEWAWDLAELEEFSGMTTPVECCKCGAVYDLGAVEVTGRYLDCTMWRTPCCKVVVDDRGNGGWGGQPAYREVRRGALPWGWGPG